MPPVASFRDTVLRLIREGQNGITSVRALEVEMARLKDADYENSVKGTVDDWLTKGREPQEPSIDLVARAFNVPRETFPLAVTRTVQRVATHERLTTLEDRQAQMATVLERLEADFDEAGTLHEQALQDLRARVLDLEQRREDEDGQATGAP